MQTRVEARGLIGGYSDKNAENSLSACDFASELSTNAHKYKLPNAQIANLGITPKTSLRFSPLFSNSTILSANTLTVSAKTAVYWKKMGKCLTCWEGLEKDNQIGSVLASQHGSLLEWAHFTEFIELLKSVGKHGVFTRKGLPQRISYLMRKSFPVHLWREILGCWWRIVHCRTALSVDCEEAAFLRIFPRLEVVDGIPCHTCTEIGRRL